MGREIMRVAPGFNWPLDKIWPGYINHWYDFGQSCALCDGTGMSPEMARLKDLWYGNAPFRPEDNGSEPFTPDEPRIHAMAVNAVRNDPGFYGEGAPAVAREARRLAALFNRSWQHHLSEADVATLLDCGDLRDFTHTFVKGHGWIKKNPPVVPTAREVNRASLGAIGGGTRYWTICKPRLAAQGLPAECAACAGEGTIWALLEAKEKAEAWEPIEPPAGEWWQVWETVSDGSPVTPSFATADELIAHLVAHGDAWDQERGTGGWARDAAESFVKKGFAPSMIVVDGHIYEPRDGSPV